MAEPLGPHSIVRLAPHVELRFDRVRQSWLLLGPERVFSPSPTAVAILEACDGQRDIRTLARVLAERFNAPAEVIERDSLCVLAGLDAKGYLAHGPTP